MEQLERLKVRIPYDEYKYEDEELYEAFLNSLLEDTRDIALNRLYPFLLVFPELPKKYEGWQIRACVELNDTYGFRGFKSYSENGLSFTRATDGMLSLSLLEELVPYVGTPERASTEVSDDNGEHI